MARPRKTKIITANIIKGGTAKTTTCAALAQAAAYDKKKVLCIDMDPQATLTLYTGADPNKPGAFQLLNGTPAAQLIQHTEQGIDVIAGSRDLATVTTKTRSGHRLADALADIKDKYEFIFIDTPGSLGELQNNALLASTDLLIPAEAADGSLEGFYLTLEAVEQIKRHNPALKVSGIVVTRYDGRAGINKFWLDVFAQKAEEAHIKHVLPVRNCSKIKEAQAFKASLYQTAPKCTAAVDYMAVYKSLKEN